MANIKRIEVTGELPFNCCENEKCQDLLGQLNAPSFGFRITYGAKRIVPNTEVNPDTPHKTGKTAMYSFLIEGEEAVRWGWLDWMEEAILEAHGRILFKKYEDIEE